MDTVQLGLHGLGPFNWLGKRILSEKVMDNIRVLIETKSKEIIKDELSNFSLVEHLFLSLIDQSITIETWTVYIIMFEIRYLNFKMCFEFRCTI